MNRSDAVSAVVCVSMVVVGAAILRLNREAAPEELVLGALAKGELPTPPDDKPLITLAAHGGVDELESLLRTKEQANEATQWGLTALHYAAAAGHNSVVRLLIERGADINRAAHVEYEFAKYKLVSGVSGDYTPVDLAVMKGREEIVALFIDQAARNLDLASALHRAASSGNTRIATMLIDRGANVDAEQGSGAFAHTPLHKAAIVGHAAMVRLLLSKGANINARTLYGYSPSSLVEKLSGEVNYRGKKPNTPLALAEMEGHTEIVQLLRASSAREQ